MYLDYVLRWPDDGRCLAETCRLIVNLYLCHLLTLNLLCFRRNKYLYIDITQQDGTYQTKKNYIRVFLLENFAVIPVQSDTSRLDMLAKMRKAIISFVLGNCPT